MFHIINPILGVREIYITQESEVVSCICHIILEKMQN